MLSTEGVLLTQFILHLQQNGIWFHRYNQGSVVNLIPSEIINLKDQFVAGSYLSEHKLEKDIVGTGGGGK